jgi:hypothetical protein
MPTRLRGQTWLSSVCVLGASDQSGYRRRLPCSSLIQYLPGAGQQQGRQGLSYPISVSVGIVVPSGEAPPPLAPGQDQGWRHRRRWRRRRSPSTQALVSDLGCRSLSSSPRSPVHSRLGLSASQSHVSREASPVPQAPLESMCGCPRGDMAGDRCDVPSGEDLSISSTGPTAVDMPCPLQPSRREVGEASIGQLAAGNPSKVSRSTHSGNGSADGEKPNNFPPPVTSPSLGLVVMGSEDSASGSGCLLNRMQAQGRNDSRGEKSVAAPSHPRSAADVISAAPPSSSHEGGSLQDVPARGCGLVGSQASATSPPPSVQALSARRLRSPPLVYSRWRAGIRAATPHPSTAEAAPVTPQGASFIRRMSKRVGGGVPRPPQVQKRHIKTMPPGITLRRSRRLARIGAEQHQHCPLAAPW